MINKGFLDNNSPRGNILFYSLLNFFYISYRKGTNINLRTFTVPLFTNDFLYHFSKYGFHTFLYQILYILDILIALVSLGYF